MLVQVDAGLSAQQFRIVLQVAQVGRRKQDHRSLRNLTGVRMRNRFRNCGNFFSFRGNSGRPGTVLCSGRGLGPLFWGGRSMPVTVRGVAEQVDLAALDLAEHGSQFGHYRGDERQYVVDVFFAATCRCRRCCPVRLKRPYPYRLRLGDWCRSLCRHRRVFPLPGCAAARPSRARGKKSSTSLISGSLSFALSAGSSGATRA